MLYASHDWQIGQNLLFNVILLAYKSMSSSLIFSFCHHNKDDCANETKDRAGNSCHSRQELEDSMRQLRAKRY